MSNEGIHLSNIEDELNQIKNNLENVVRLLQSIDETLGDILDKKS